MAGVYEIEGFDPLNGVGYLLRRTRTHLLDSLDRELAADEQLRNLEVSSAQLIILNVLTAGAPRSARDLCEELRYDAGAMTRMISRLEQKGLLRRQRSRDDRRMVILRLTDKGKSAIPALRRASTRALNGMLRNLTRTEARSLESLLARLLANALRKE